MESFDHTYFSNKACRYYPCHQMPSGKDINCLFCFCPMYAMDCLGSPVFLENGVKDCSNCIYPHIKENYDKIMGKLSEGKG